MAGDLYDLYIGPDLLTGVDQFVRIQVEEHYPDRFGRTSVRFKAVGGGPTNVPRWEQWPTLVFDHRVVASMMRCEQLACVPDMVGEPTMP